MMTTEQEKPTHEFIFSQTMLRIRDPAQSIPFYRDVLGMTLLERFDFPDMKFSLYFLAYIDDPDSIPVERLERIEYIFRQKAALELTHNWGTEDETDFPGYHNGNTDPRGFGHIGLTVPDVDEACARFDSLGVQFVKRPADGKMKGLAFIRDPDGYWIEILSAKGLTSLIEALSG